MKSLSGKQSLHWGKGIKKLIDKAVNLGYRFEIQGENVIMKFEGKCPRNDEIASHDNLQMKEGNF